MLYEKFQTTALDSFKFLVHQEDENAQELCENVAVDKISAYVIYESPPRLHRRSI